VIHNEIRVLLGERSYPIYVGSDIGADLGPTFRAHNIPDQLILVTDRIVGSLYLRSVKSFFRAAGFDAFSIVLPSGEKEKTLSRANAIFTAMLKHGIGRKAAVVALGGGVIGDLAGFVAATYQRGIPLVQIPTTLLAQVDSSIGGKTAVNHPLGKNMIGAFHQPALVWTDIRFLSTLPQREVVCGLGEIFKYGLILDADLFSYVETNLDQILTLQEKSILHVQATCSRLKADLVSHDERETGKRIILNMGHTLGHALEAAGNYNLLKHGEAVLLGIAGESFIARELQLLSVNDFERIIALLRRVPLRLRLRSLPLSRVMSAMARDKKGVGGRKRFVLPVKIGETTIVDTVPPELIRSSLVRIVRMFSGSAGRR